ncbi:MAG: hypothetical protein IJC08_03420 [Bacteroidaceae bacterium]|nr:hypothetical protein [Bacteroidaceae bacterium]
MIKRFTFFGGMVLVALTVNAQSYKEGYVQWGEFGQQFGTTVSNWTPGQELNEDDNFFISRVKPKARFRNAATQVRSTINETNDKRLLMWVPVDDVSENALPNGVYDSEVFSMWSYITHYGNWTAPQGRMPGNFADVAHKNGVAVSSVAGIPYGGLYEFPAWQQALQELVAVDVEKTAKFLHYYGLDGLGYNSEFSGGAAIMRKLVPYHKELTEAGRALNPIYENMWYDGTNETGGITFDRGLGTHNDDILRGAGLFFNYNWSYLLGNSVTYAQNNDLDPLSIYAGMNMQGAEGNYWTTLKDYPISIGLWGAHSQNMFWESRGEKGSAPDVKQRTYMLRTERWFTGGTRNPANCPEVINSMKYNADNFNFHGMAALMSARSSLSWDLSVEPFVTYFNLGNGTYFNWNGERQHNEEWYNIGVQDYLPTWRWWFASSLLGTDVPSEGLDAEFVWDEAWVGGSTARIFGSTESEYLHLFKTQFEVKSGDVITFRYKLKAGSADVKLVLTDVGSEKSVADDLVVCTADQEADEDVWVEQKMVVGEDVTNSNIALVALKFENAENLDLYLGEFSIVRGKAATPDAPVITTTKVLAFNENGVDAKIIFNMKNNKPAGEPCYNIDVNVSLFKLYAQQEGGEPVLMGITTSWAGLFYRVQMDMTKADKVRFGVSAVSLDMSSESNIAWSEYMDAGTYVYNDDIQISKTTIKPGEDFVLSYVDPRHEEASWTITNISGETVFEGTGHTVEVAEGLSAIGSYNLTVKGYEYDASNERVETTRTFASYIQITGEGVGALPKILTLTADGKEADITVNPADKIALAYTGRKADGAGSQGVDLKEERFGVKCADLGIVGIKTFSTAFWLKINKLAAGETQLLAVANKVDAWPKTDWGWIWTNIKEDGTMGSFTFRGTDSSNNDELRYMFGNTNVPVGTWVHIAFVFEYEGTKIHARYYVNGVQQEVTGWNRQNSSGSGTSDPGFVGPIYQITDGMVLSIGGSAHGRNGIDGVIDNFQFWNKAMTDEDIATSMGDIDPNNLPEGLAAYWDLETPAGADNTFKSVGTLAGVEAGVHNYAATGGEGQGAFSWIASEYTSGCPFVAGTAYPVVTSPEWKAKKGVVENVTGNDTAGSATVSYNKLGDYAVTLTLANSLGSDQRTFQVITVNGETGIAGVENGEISTYVVEGAAIVEFAEEGNYNVALFTADGRKVASKAAHINAAGTMQLTMGVKGVYVLAIEKDGKPVRTVKLLNK